MMYSVSLLVCSFSVFRSCSTLASRAWVSRRCFSRRTKEYLQPQRRKTAAHQFYFILCTFVFWEHSLKKVSHRGYCLSVHQSSRIIGFKCLITWGISCIRFLPLLSGLNIKSSTTHPPSLRIWSTLPFPHSPHCHRQSLPSIFTPIHQVCFFLSLVHYTNHQHPLSLQILHTHRHPDNNNDSYLVQDLHLI